MITRPVLIDEADGACEICAEWSGKPGCCKACGEALPEGRGIESCVPHHFHLTVINGSCPGRRGIPQELCKECAIALRLKVYPPDQTDKHGNHWPTAEQMRAYRG